MVKSKFDDKKHIYARNKAREYYNKDPFKKKVYHMRKKWNIDPKLLEQFESSKDKFDFLQKEVFKIKYKDYFENEEKKESKESK